MINVNLDILNQLEMTIYKTILNSVKSVNEDTVFNISTASNLCGVSTSKVSKTVKKLGFKNYKEFIKYCRGDLVETNESQVSDELKRISNYIENFDDSIVSNVIKKINNFDKIVIYGLGPSFICAQYFEYKLRTCTSKSVLAVNDEVQIKNTVDSDTLFIILSVTGKFSSFDHVCNIIEKNQGEVLIILEEYNSIHYPGVKNIIYLTNFKQSDELEPYEKTRTVLFIFIEEIIRKLSLMSNIE